MADRVIEPLIPEKKTPFSLSIITTDHVIVFVGTDIFLFF